VQPKDQAKRQRPHDKQDTLKPNNRRVYGGVPHRGIPEPVSEEVDSGRGRDKSEQQKPENDDASHQGLSRWSGPPAAAAPQRDVGVHGSGIILVGAKRGGISCLKSESGSVKWSVSMRSTRGSWAAT